MSGLSDLIREMGSCNKCGLMEENAKSGIRFVPVKPKPKAQVVFIGRDPSPNTARVVGEEGGRSVFINEIFALVAESGYPKEGIYITDLVKCHWRTSAGGSPVPGTQGRSTEVDKTKAQTCMDAWLAQELGVLKPRLVVAFGEEVYSLLSSRIVSPQPVPAKLSASIDKSIPDAESWFADNGPFQARLGGQEFPIAFLRHPGNSRQLTRDPKDKRVQAYEASRKRLVNMLRVLATDQS